MQSIPARGRRANATTSSDALFAFMVSKAKCRDRLYFCSDDTAARELGLSRRTIIRARQRLESDGRIVRRGQHRIGRCRATVVYSFPTGHRRLPHAAQTASVTQRLSGRSTRTPSIPRFARDGAWYRVSSMSATTAACPMTLPLPGLEPLAPPRAITAQTIVGATVEYFASAMIPLNSRYKGQIARQAKQLLDDGFTPVLVLGASIQACRRSEPHQMTAIAQDIANAKGGFHLTRRQSERKLQDAIELGLLETELDQLDSFLKAGLL